MQQRTDNPILPYLAAAVIIVFTPIFFPLAVFVYKIIRPHEKIGEVYERNLAEEALLAEVEAIQHCPTCDRRVNDEWIICPTCRTRLNRVCPNCSRLVGLDWSLCAWCGKDFERREVAAAAVLEPTAVRRRRRPPAIAASTAAERRPGPPVGRDSLTGERRRAAAPARTPIRRRRPAGSRRTVRSPGPAAPDRGTAADPDPGTAARRRHRASGPARRVDVHDRGPRGARRSSSSAGSATLARARARRRRRPVRRRRRRDRAAHRRPGRSSSLGLIAAAGSQAHRAPGARARPTPGPSPFLVFAAAIADLAPGRRPRRAAARRLLGDRRRTGPVGAAPRRSLVQALVFIGLVRLLVVGTGALSWAEMGLRRLGRRALRRPARRRRCGRCR